MATVTNVSRRLIHAGDTMLVPGVPVDLSDDMMKNRVIQSYVKAGDIREGEVEVKPEVAQDDGDPAPPRAPAANTAPAKAQQANSAAAPSKTTQGKE